MNIKVQSLTLQCRKSREVIRFASQVTFFHGGIGAGKSSIARLIDFCLGGNIEQTQAIKKELVSVELSATLGEHSVIFEREAQGSNQTQVTWTNPAGDSATVLAPKQASNAPIWGEHVFNLSDLVFHLCGVTPIKVRRSKQDEDSPLIRLSFRDVMWYCYLEQDKLDSSFYRLHEPILQAKSRDVMRFVVGYYTDRLQELEIELERVTNERASKLESTRQIKAFLEKFGFDDEKSLEEEYQRSRDGLKVSQSQQQKTRESFQKETHFTDDLRQQLRQLSDRLAQEQQTLADLHKRIDDQQSLKAELTTARFKLARAESASDVLSRVRFERCPACGSKIEPASQHATGHCYLCGHDPSTDTEEDAADRNEAAKQDLQARIAELNESIDRAKRSARRQDRIEEEVREQKAELDDRLTQELANYDSKFVAETREVDRQIATLQERLKSLERLKQLPAAAEQLAREADQLRADEERLRREIETEKKGLTSAHEVIRAIEKTYLDTLLAIGLPGVSSDDTVILDRKNWVPSILEGGDEALQWNFYNTGSGGKKTLLNVSYAVALHVVASERKLPLPTFLIIDTPMKNIGEEVNKDVFVSFYKHLYSLIDGPLNQTQLIVIDKEYIPPSSDTVDLEERFMTPDQDEDPPLITYYRGP